MENSSYEVVSASGCTVTTSGEAKEFDENSWVIAVCLAVVAAFVNNLGVNLQKLAWTKKQRNDNNYHLYRTYWILGILGICLASFCDFAALAFGPQSVIAPLGSLTMVANAFVAPMMHGEKLHPKVIVSTVVIVAGCALSVAAASHSNENCGIDQLFALYSKPRFIFYALVVCSIILGSLHMIKRCESIVSVYGNSSVQYQQVYKFHRFSYAAVSGIFGAQSVLFAKSVDQLLISTTRDSEKRLFLAYPGTYMVVGAMVGCIVLQIYYLNQGLARFESLYNVPVFTSTWIVGTVIGGGVFYGEFSQFTWLQALAFPLGVGLCVSGVVFLSRSTNESEDSGAFGTLDGLEHGEHDNDAQGSNGVKGRHSGDEDHEGEGDSELESLVLK